MADDKKKRTTVEIYGESYTIVGSESARNVRAVARFVDDKMREIRDNNPYLDTKRIAVLTAVNVVNDYLKLQDEYDQLAEKHKKEEE